MADKKITQLPSLSFISGSTTGYYAGEVVLPIVHNSTTVKMEAQKFALYATQWSATTASNTFIGNQTINGNVVVTGKLTAQEVHTEITSASIIFESGSTIFGNTADDTHTFTGTININGNVVGNAPLDFTSQSLNIATGSYNRFYDVTSSVHFTTASLNTQTGSQQLINVQNSTVTSSLNLATASLNFTTGALNIASGSYNRFYQVTASVHSTTSSLNQATSSLNFASGALEIATGSYNRFYDMTSSVHFTTQSLNVQTGSQELINVQNSIVSSSLNFASASINFTTGALNSFTGSIISQTNTIATFTSSVNFATSSLNVQTGSQDLVNLRISSTTGSINTTTSSFDSVFLRISSVTGSMNTQSSSQDSVNYQNSIVTSSFRNEIGGIEAYTASLKSAIVVNGTNVRIIGELTASRIYTEFITSSVLFVTGSNIIGDQSTDKHEFTGSVNINDTLFIKGQAIGTGQLNAFTGSQIGKDFTLSIVTSSIDAHILKQATQTGSQDLVNLGISTYTGSQNVINSSVDAHILKQATQTGSQDLVNYNISVYTGSQNVINTSVNSHILAQSTQTGSQDLVNLGISTYTGSQNVINTSIDAHILKQATQTGSQDLVNLGISTFTGSLRSEVNLIEAYTASLKAAAIVSSSQQITNYYKFAETASANVFYGNQTITGSLNVGAGNITVLRSVGGAAVIVESTATSGEATLTLTGKNSSGTVRSSILKYDNADVLRLGSASPIPIQFETNDVARISIASGISSGDGSVTISTGNLVIGTAGKGIDFSTATPDGAGMTSELLDDYEEGTWTGTLKGSVADPTTPVTATGYYTKVGNKVFATIAINNATTTGASGIVTVSGLPFTSAATNNSQGSVMSKFYDFNGGTSLVALLGSSTTNVNIMTSGDDADWNDVLHTAGSSRSLRFSITYLV
jgi:predicted Fe-Mo cluster-binding NifX family protein